MDLSIIIPVYNSERIIDKLIDKIVNSVDDIKSINSYEIILINDFSPDNCWDKIKFLSKKFNFIKGISLTQNFGQHNAIMAGLNECVGKKIITMDDDLQHLPSSISDIINELDKGFDVCYAEYLNRKHPPWRRFVSWFNNIVSSYLLNKPYKIYLSSFRGFKKKISKEIINYHGPSPYIDGLILKITRNITIIPVEHYERPHGSSNYNFKKLMSLWADMAIDFPIFPLRLSTIFGVIILSVIFSIRKISSLIKKDKKFQYVINEKTYEDLK